MQPGHTVVLKTVEHAKQLLQLNHDMLLMSWEKKLEFCFAKVHRVRMLLEAVQKAIIVKLIIHRKCCITALFCQGVW